MKRSGGEMDRQKGKITSIPWMAAGEHTCIKCAGVELMAEGGSTDVVVDRRVVEQDVMQEVK